MSRAPRPLPPLVLVLALAVPAAADPPRHEVEVEALVEPVEIVYDGWGVPHVRSSSERDSWMAIGFTHARDRFFQMDVARRTIGGTRAELFGDHMVDDDHDMRFLGLAWAADVMWDDLGPDDRTVLEHYAAGVNAWRAALVAGDPGLVVPPEYGDLGLALEEIAPWRPQDSIQILGGFVFSLTQAIDIDLLMTLVSLEMPNDVRADAYRIAPIDTVPALYPGEYPDHLRPSGPLPGGDSRDGPGDVPGGTPDDTPDGPAGALPGQRPAPPPGIDGDLFFGLDDAARAAYALWGRLLDSNPWLEDGGSNAWVVGADRSESGLAIFSSDNHVGTPLPPIYHELHLSAPQASLEVYGVTIPGSPVFANGFNESVAWAYTVLPVDGTDLFWDRLPFRDKVSFMGRLVDVEVRHETYMANVDGELVDRTELVEEPITRYVPHHGPILGTALFGRRALSYRWVGFEESTFIEPLLRRMRAGGVDEALEASQSIDVFGANMVVADVFGEIGYTVTGTFPVRWFKDLYQPFWPRLGGGLWEWRGRLEREDYLSTVSPARAFVATSNNDPAGYSFDNRTTNDPVYYGYAHDHGLRQRRIHQEILARTPVTTHDMEVTQTDVTVEVANRLVPHLAAAAEARPDLVDERGEEAIAMLEAWDRRALRTSHENSIFHEWWLAAAHDLFDDDTGAEWFVDHTALGGLIFLLERPEDAQTGTRLWDDQETPELVEAKEDILLGALARTLDYLTDRFGTDEMTLWLWGDMHGKRFDHPLGGDYSYPPRSEPSRPSDGGDHTVSPMSSGFRLVAEMDPDGIRARMVLPGGNSGLPSSPHYTDQAEMYLDGEYREVLLEDEAVDADAEEILVLVPAPAPGLVD